METNKIACSGNLDYKELYFAAMNTLADLSDSFAKALQDLEEMYLDQTQPDVPQDNKLYAIIHRYAIAGSLWQHP